MSEFLEKIRKIQLICVALVFFVALPAAAAPSPSFSGEVKYVVPVSDPSIEPYSAFYVSNFTVSQDDGGSFSIDLTLPADLTAGTKVQVNLVETGRSGKKISFTKDIGTAECVVANDWDTAICTYTFNQNFKDLVPVAKAENYLNKKYKGDASLIKRKKVVVDGFLRSTDPIGKAFPKKQSCTECALGNGTWTTSYASSDDQTVVSEMELVQHSGRYFNAGGSGTLSNVQYSGNTAQGSWKYGSSTGWFEFNFNGDAFVGSWGMGNFGSPQAGFWNGQLK